MGYDQLGEILLRDVSDEERRELCISAKRYLSKAGPLTPKELSRLLELDSTKLVALLSSPSTAQEILCYAKKPLYYLRGQEAYVNERLKNIHRPVIFAKMERMVYRRGRRKLDGFHELMAKLERVKEGKGEIHKNGAYDGGIDGFMLFPGGRAILYQFKNVKHLIGEKTVGNFIDSVYEVVKEGELVIAHECTLVKEVIKARFYTSSAFKPEVGQYAKQRVRDLELHPVPMTTTRAFHCMHA